MMSLPKRFWDKVNIKDSASACWVWMAARDQKGYGMFQLNGRSHRAHRLALVERLGREIRTGMIAMHACDNPSCVNPLHLSEGTPRENVMDCKSKGRRADTFGEKNPNAKLANVDREAMRAEFAALARSGKGYTMDGDAKSLARKYGVTYRRLMQVVGGGR